MSLRRCIRLAALAADVRPACVAELADTMTRQLLLRFPKDLGYEHEAKWGVAVCARDNRLSAEAQAAFRRLEYTVWRGRWWGFKFILEPRDQQYGSLKLIVKSSLPALGTARGVVVAGAGILALLGGIAVAISRFIYGGRPMLMGSLFGALIFVVACFLGLILLQPLIWIFARRLRGEIGALSGIISDSWDEVRTKVPLLSSEVSEEWSPAVKSLILTIAASSLAAGCWWAYQSFPEQGGVALGIAAWVIIPIAGLTAAGALVMLILNLLEITD